MRHLTPKQERQVLHIADNIQGEVSMPVQGEDERSIAFVTLFRICRDYAVKGANFGAYRNKRLFFERLEKFHIRFFDDI